MKKILLGITALSALAGASVSTGAPVPNQLGVIPSRASATIYCSASRFFSPPSTPTATVEMDQVRPGGLETNFLVTNVSDSQVLRIVKVEVFSIAGALIATLTPDNLSPIEGEPDFKWVLSPHETTRLPQKATLPLTQQTKPDLLWNNVVFTVTNNSRGPINAPLVYSDYVEYETPKVGGNVLDRIRAECVYR